MERFVERLGRFLIEWLDGMFEEMLGRNLDEKRGEMKIIHLQLPSLDKGIVQFVNVFIALKLTNIFCEKVSYDFSKYSPLLKHCLPPGPESP